MAIILSVAEYKVLDILWPFLPTVHHLPLNILLTYYSDLLIDQQCQTLRSLLFWCGACNVVLLEPI